MENVDGRILKVKCPKAEGWRLLPFLPLLPEEECVFDFFHGTIGFDVFPFSVTTRVNHSNQIFIKVYEDVPDSKTIPLNPMPDGSCRTLKRQYQQSSLANFFLTGSFGATGVIEYEDHG